MVSRKKRKRRKNFSQKSIEQQYFKDTINFLLERSLHTRTVDTEESKNLNLAARKMGKRGRVHIPRKYHALFCHSCYTPFAPNTARIRLNSKKQQIHYYCKICHQEKRIGYRMK